MPILYTRHETNTEIVIVYKYHAAFYLVLLAVLLIPLTGSQEKFGPIVPVLFVLFAILWIAGHWAANQEVKRAMKTGNVTVHGSKFSFKNPFTFTIKK